VERVDSPGERHLSRADVHLKSIVMKVSSPMRLSELAKPYYLVKLIGWVLLARGVFHLRGLAAERGLAFLPQVGAGWEPTSGVLTPTGSLAHCRPDAQARFARTMVRDPKSRSLAGWLDVVAGDDAQLQNTTLTRG
jgi:hypothetical protein